MLSVEATAAEGGGQKSLLYVIVSIDSWLPASVDGEHQRCHSQQEEPLSLSALPGVSLVMVEMVAAIGERRIEAQLLWRGDQGAQPGRNLHDPNGATHQ